MSFGNTSIFSFARSFLKVDQKRKFPSKQVKRKLSRVLIEKNEFNSLNPMSPSLRSHNFKCALERTQEFMNTHSYIYIEIKVKYLLNNRIIFFPLLEHHHFPSRSCSFTMMNTVHVIEIFLFSSLETFFFPKA